MIEVHVLRQWKCTSCGYIGQLIDKEMPPKVCPICINEPIRKWTNKRRTE